MIRLFEYVRSRLGAKVIAAFTATLAIAATAQIIVTFQFGSSLAEQAAHESSEALQSRARAALERLTREQAARYDQIFSEAGRRTRMLAWQAGHQLTWKSATEPAFPLELRWRPEMAFHFNDASDPISLLHWGDATVTATARQQMRALTHMSTPLNRAQREIQGAAAAWILTEKRVGVYSANRPGIESSAPADEAAMLDSRSYRTGDAAPGQTRWTEVFEDVAGEGPIITAAAPIYGPDNEAFLGVAGIDLTVRSTVNRVLTQDPLGIDPPADANGPPAELSFLMDAHTRPTAVPGDHRSLLGLPTMAKQAPGEALSEPPLAEAGPTDLRQAARRAVENDHLLVDDLTLNGQTYIAAFHTIAATDWVLANVVAEKALLSKVASTREAIGQRVASMTAILAAFGAGVILLMATGLMLYFRRAVLRPLGRLAEATERMGSGHYRVAVPVRGKDELARVGQSFNDLSGRLADVLEDLEQRVRARTREAESAKDYFRTILNSSPVGIAFLDGERRIQQVNPAFTDLLGRSEEAVLGQTTEILYADPDEYRRIGEEAYPFLQAGEVFHTMTTLQHPHGRRLTVSLMGRAVDPQDLSAGYIWTLQDITEQKERERDLLKYRAVFESSRDAIFLWNENGFLECNPAGLRLFALPSHEAVQNLHPADLSPTYQPDGRPSEEAAQEHMRQAFETGQAFFEWQHRTLRGETFPAEVLISRGDFEEGPILESVVRDISEQKAAFEKVEQARRRAEGYFEVARVMMLVLDLDGRIAAINKRGSELLGLPRDDLIGRNWFQQFLPAEEKEKAAQIFQALREEGDGVLPEEFENEVLTGTGARRLMAFRNAVLRDPHGELEGILSSGYDVTDQRALEEKLRYQARHDPLTGLVNRRSFEEALAQEIHRAQRYKQPFALIMFDIDHFKAINDTYGHELGDRILEELAEEVSNRLREADLFARWGGEEFMALLPETDAEGAHQVAEAVCHQVADRAFPGVGGVTISLGVAEYRDHEALKDVTKRVDEALYAAKEAGRNRVVVDGEDSNT